MKGLILFLLVFAINIQVTNAAAKKSIIPIPENIGHAVVLDYSKHIFNSYSDVLKTNQELLAALKTFIKSPSMETQNAAKTAWITARQAYSLSEPFRFYGGPIDEAASGVEGLMNAWPLDEVYIDYVEGNKNAGIINNPKLFPTITKDLLVSANAKDGERNISTGYHAVEFLLWGQDLDLKSAGKRSYEDYITSKNPNAERRAIFLRLLGELLVEHSEILVKAWTPNIEGNYADRFNKFPLNESLQKIFLGAATLSMDEMSGERMTVPLEKHDQENEQNCFSDTTTLDLMSNQRGVLSVYTGDYNGFKGNSLKDLVASFDKKLDQKIAKQMNQSADLLKSIPTPFDNVIMEKNNGKGRKIAYKAIESLQAQAKLLAKAAFHFGLDINIEHGK